MLARSITAILWLGWAFAQLRASPLPSDAPRRGPIDGDTIAAYEKLGAEYGGIKIALWIDFTKGKEAAAKELPGFHFAALPDGGLPGLLPPVGVHFGLDFHGTDLTDA
jgi:hypothetical protein